MKMFRYFKPYAWLMIPLVILVYLQVMANLELPNYMAKIVNEGIIGSNLEAIYNNGGTMLLVTFGGGLAAIGVGFLAARIATGFARDVRRKVFEKVESFSITEFNSLSTASLITRTTNDVQQVQTVALMVLRMMLFAPFMAIGALQNALQNAPNLSWIIVLAVCLLFMMIAVLFTTVIPKFRVLQKLVDKLNLVTRENLTGLRVIRAFNNEKVEEKKFDKVNIDLARLSLFVNRLMIILQPFITLLMNLALIAIVWFGAQLISESTIEIGNMMAFMQYATQVIMSFLMLSVVFIVVPRAAVSVKRINEVLDTESTIRDPQNPKKITRKGRGRIEFRDVTFTYPDANTPVLSGINFTAEPGQTTAFIGSTGSGKSTLIGLIPRFYDVTAGQVLIDGVDVRNLRLSDLYSQIGYVPQKGVLFSGTVRSNIAYGNRRANKKDVEQAAKVAQASEFINKLAGSYQSSIAQGGANVSGGQKQRLSIARALAVKPKVYIFDDSFSALDFKTDAKLRQALTKETKGKTVLIIGQRISTIMNADKIIVMNEGKIVDQGSHAELLEHSPIYQEIAHSQLSDEELTRSKSTNKEAR